MASTTTAHLWALLLLGCLFIATAVFGTALGMADGEYGVIGAKLLLCAFRPS